ncbi:MAG: hypothetical protein KBB86_00930 [Candidatus Pacebacteria bacterium]|nr:hypothetical protein [Candidatus Paceibacterota bacterium]
METLFIIIFVLAPLFSLIISNTLYIKEHGDTKHFFHVFSISYLIMLLLGEITNSLSDRSGYLAIAICCIIVATLFLKDVDEKKGLFSHHHHSKLSTGLAVVFVLHSFFDGLFFSFEGLQVGLILHRAIDGFVVAGLIGNEDVPTMNFWKIKTLKRFSIFLLLVIAPVIGIILPGAVSDSFSWVQTILMVILVPFLAVDVLSEFHKEHRRSSNNIFYIAIFFAFMAGLFSLH